MLCTNGEIITTGKIKKLDKCGGDYWYVLGDGCAADGALGVGL
jgi:hypothetical protein